MDNSTGPSRKKVQSPTVRSNSTVSTTSESGYDGSASSSISDNCMRHISTNPFLEHLPGATAALASIVSASVGGPGSPFVPSNLYKKHPQLSNITEYQSSPSLCNVTASPVTSTPVTGTPTSSTPIRDTGTSTANSTPTHQPNNTIRSTLTHQTSSPSPSNGSLNPILAQQARTRSFLVGNLGCQDGILGSDELTRYFPNNTVNILLITWNMSGNKPPEELNDLLLPDALLYVPDIYAIALQEGVHGEMTELETRMQTTIGPSHVLLHCVSHGVLCLAIFVRRDLIWFFSQPEDDIYNTRPSSINMLKTKGAVAISFQFFGTTFLFINSHLPAHEQNNKYRKEQYEKIIQSLDLPRNLRPLKPRYISDDVTGRFDICFWLGDLNFRVERSYDDAINLLDQIKNSDDPSYNSLLQTDQLTRGMSDGSLFTGFSEVSTINFPPTFKHILNEDDYDCEFQRVPSYTDRILYRSKRSGHVICNAYDSIRGSIMTSDHRPVFASVTCEIRPGKDTIPLNAGAFRRDIYLEGLKRRAEENFGTADKKTPQHCVLS